MHFPLLLAAAPLKHVHVGHVGKIGVDFPLLLAAAPLKPRAKLVLRPARPAFSAAFSGGPIEAAAGRPDVPEAYSYFPLLLAAAPLKLRTSICQRRAATAFSAAFSGGPIEASLASDGPHDDRLIFRCF